MNPAQLIKGAKIAAERDLELRREKIATAIMAGFAASMDSSYSAFSNGPAAKFSVIAADSLIAELKKLGGAK